MLGALVIMVPHAALIGWYGGYWQYLQNASLGAHIWGLVGSALAIYGSCASGMDILRAIQVFSKWSCAKPAQATEKY